VEQNLNALLEKGRLHLSVGELSQAQAAFEEALQLAPQNSEALHQLGMVQQQQGNFPGATESYHSLLKVSPQNPEVHSQLGVVLYLQGKTEEAVEHYQIAITLKPDFAEVYNNLGVAFHQQKRLVEAIHHYRQAVELNPQFYDASNNLGLALSQQGQHEAAIPWFHKAIATRADDTASHINLGSTYKALQQFTLAIESFQNALKYSAQDPVIHFKLAHSYECLGAFEEAAAYYEKAVSLKPDYVAALNNLGLMRQQQGRLEEAIGCYESALHYNPNLAEGYLNLGTVYEQLDQKAQALEAYEKALQARPDFVLPLNNQGNIYRQQGRFNEAIAVFEKALTLKPDYTDALFNLGHLLQELKRYSKAIECYQRVLSLKPDQVETYNNLGLIYQKQGKLDQAIETFNTALGFNATVVFALHNLGMTYLMQGKRQEAINTFQRALANNPEDAFAYNNLGSVYCREPGHLQKAIVHFKKALELNPELFEAHKNLGGILLDSGATEEGLKHLEQAIALQPTDGLRVKIATALPPIYASSEDVTQWRQRYQAQVETLKSHPLHVSDPIEDLGATCFYLAYQGGNDRSLQEDVGTLFSNVNLWTQCPPVRNKKPTIGFISLFFAKEHTIGKLMLGMINGLDVEKFDVVVFTMGHFPAPEITRPHTHLNLIQMNLPYAIETVAAQHLDVLLYSDIGMEPLTYFLGFNRLAPVQCVTWGHPVTTGVPTIDYFLSSRLLEPENAQEHYSEELVLFETLPTYYYRPQLDPEKAMRREQFGFTAEDHLYLCPQTLFKFHPDFDPLLADILRQDPQGILVMIQPTHNQWAQLLTKRFQRTMPDVAERIRFLDKMSWEGFLSLVSHADVMLDTLHFGGGNTTYEALAFGTPIVTLPSAYMRGRVTMGCYQKMGLPDCIVDSPQAYVELAVRLGTNPDYRATIKSRILAANHVLYEDAATIRELESFFIRAIETASSRISPETPSKEDVCV
jgi:protein O-GlcNAc transferase